jgi:hypothetical protein
MRYFRKNHLTMVFKTDETPIKQVIYRGGQ